MTFVLDGSISEEIVETWFYAVLRLLPCCSVSLAASSHAVGFALEELPLPLPDRNQFAGDSCSLACSPRCLRHRRHPW